MSAPARSGAQTAASANGNGAIAVAGAADSRRRHPPRAHQRRAHGQPRRPAHGNHHAPSYDHSQPAHTSSATSSSGSSSSNNNTAAAVESTPPHPSPASRLYRHALESILAFSDLQTLAAAARVSKEWLGAVESMRSLAFTIQARPAVMKFVAASAISRHVSELTVVSSPRLVDDAMGRVAQRMPQLRRLDCLYPRVYDGPLVFPSGLQHLELRVLGDNDPFGADDINAAVAAAGRLERLESLAVCKICPLISLAPLAALPLLRRLTISYGWPDSIDARVDQLRALPRLDFLDVYSISTSLLRRLLAQPHDLQWRQITVPRTLSDADTALLPQLPSLTALKFFADDLSDYDFLRRLPNLASVHCGMSLERQFDALYIDRVVLPFDTRVTDQLVAGLRHCTAVTDLHLDRCEGMTAAHLAGLLPRLPRLHSLTLDDLEIDSLGFLAQPPATNRLHSLGFSHCERLPVAELRHLHSLRGLRQLRISNSLKERMDPDCAALVALRPPSAVMPLLESFVYDPWI